MCASRSAAWGSGGWASTARFSLHMLGVRAAEQGRGDPWQRTNKLQAALAGRGQRPRTPPAARPAMRGRHLSLPQRSAGDHRESQIGRGREDGHDAVLHRLIAQRHSFRHARAERQLYHAQVMVCARDLRHQPREAPPGSCSCRPAARTRQAFPGRQAVAADAARGDLLLQTGKRQLHPAAKGRPVHKRELRFGILEVVDVDRPRRSVLRRLQAICWLRKLGAMQWMPPARSSGSAIPGAMKWS